MKWGNESEVSMTGKRKGNMEKEKKCSWLLTACTFPTETDR